MPSVGASRGPAPTGITGPTMGGSRRVGWDPVAKWALDIQGNDYQPDPQYNPPGCAVGDSRRNRVWRSRALKLPWVTLGSMIRPRLRGPDHAHQNNTLGLRQPLFSCV
jgi:hypothetical protein